jgi:hypothetical protein
MVKYVDGKKIGVYFIPFSLYLALGRHNIATRPFGVAGLIQKGERYIVTVQSKRVVEARGVGRLIDIPESKGLSFHGFAMEWEDGPMEAVYAELGEELGLDKDDVTEVRKEMIISEKGVVLAALFRTDLEEDVMQKLKALAIDGWEASDVMLMGKGEARGFLKDSGKLAMFDRLVL